MDQQTKNHHNFAVWFVSTVRSYNMIQYQLVVLVDLDLED
jgi:hypothetical protein